MDAPLLAVMPPWEVRLYLLGELLALATVPFVLLSKRPAQAKLAWILVLVGWPFLGLLFYVVFGRSRLARKVLRLRSERAVRIGSVVERTSESARRSQATWGLAADLQREAEAAGGSPPFAGNEVLPLTEGPDAFRSAFEAVEAARHHVHLLTYIFKSDTTGRGVLDALIRAARRGVEVRLLYDALGSLSLPRGFLEPLEQAGGLVAAFLPLRSHPFRVNLRNHRKILVVDGHTGFMGGMNIGDEYATGKDWRDIHCRVRGPAVAGLQRVFVEDWHFATETLLDQRAYFPDIEARGDVTVQVVRGGPDLDEPAVEHLIFGALSGAERTIDIVTPYFVPTEPLAVALRSALLRGRRVRLLQGTYIDHRLARWAAELALPALMDAGLEVWEHPGMVHGKMLVVDGAWATVGSTNLDPRSLRLNFEVNLAFAHAGAAAALEAHFERELEASKRLRREDLRFGLPGRLLRNLAGLFGPIL